MLNKMKQYKVICDGKLHNITENISVSSKSAGEFTVVSKKVKRKKQRKSMIISNGREESKENSSEMVCKRRTADSFNIQSPSGENASSVVNKKKKKRKKHSSLGKDLGGRHSNLEVNDEPNPKRLKKDTGSIEQLSVVQVASVCENITSPATKKKKKKKKKKNKGGMCVGDAKPKDSDDQLSSICIPSSQTSKTDVNLECAPKNCNENLTGKRKKKRQKKKAVKNGGSRELQVNCNVNCDPVIAPREDSFKSSNSGKENSSKMGKKVNKEVVTMGNAQENTQSENKKKRKKKRNVKNLNDVLETIDNGNGDSAVTSSVQLVNASSKTMNRGLENEELKQNTESKKNQKKKGKNSSMGSMSLESNESIKQPSKMTKCDLSCDTLPRLNSLYDDKSSVEDLTKCWKLQSHHKKENGFELLTKPFRCAYMPAFLQDSNFLQKVVEELSEIDLIKKNNDLYKFRQTPDLKNVSSTYISSLRRFLYGDFRKWLSDITGIELNDTVDMGSSRYEYTDVLLCHDDELEGRRIAYILYLVPEWNDKDGGMLDLFNTDQNGLPNAIVESLMPRWNTFAFFEVSPVSFHQVNEVLSRDKVRLSINGWFHGSDIKRPPKYVEPPRPVLSPAHIEQDELYSWINPSYLDMETQRKIRKKFQKDSEIELESFFCDEKYEELTSALQSNHLKWLKMGPANKQSCKILKQENLPEIIQNCFKFFQSEAMFLILSQLTGLELHHLAPPDSDPDSDEEIDKKDFNPGMVTDIRKWSHGCYTLIRDDQGYKTSALDAMFFLHVANRWSLENGGFTSYIARDEDEELLTVVPHSNCLALVYCDTDSLKFTKYVNASVKDLGEQNSFFYDVSCTYFQ